MNTRNIRTYQNKFLHGKSKFSTWLGGSFKMLYFQGNVNNNLQETYASIINSTFICEEIITKHNPNVDLRKIDNTIGINVTAIKNDSMGINEECEQGINEIKSFNGLDDETNNIVTSLRFIK